MRIRWISDRDDTLWTTIGVSGAWACTGKAAKSGGDDDQSQQHGLLLTTHGQRSHYIADCNPHSKGWIRPVNETTTATTVTTGDSWSVAGRTFTSRLIVGTGKYKDFAQNAAAVEASGAEIVTVAVRRVNISDPSQPVLMDYIDPKKITYLPNTAGCFTAEDAIRTLRLAREAGGWDLVKLEVLGEARTLYPNMRETLRATEVLAGEGFLPMVYCADDPIAAKQLEEAGAVAIMPLGAPIGSGLGLQNQVMIRLIVEGASVPVLVDAGVGTASDAAVAMELGCDGVLMNTAIAEAKDPMRDGTGDEAGGRGRSRGLSRRADAEAPLCRSEQSAGGIDLSRNAGFAIVHPMWVR